MSAVARAVWFIENHFATRIALDDIATAAGVSRYHLTRVFGDVTGHSIMRYVRGRRLTEAARSLADGAKDILTVALTAGYGSHEAFTRGNPQALAPAFTVFANDFGLPAISVPCDFDDKGLPIGLQCVGKPWDDSVVLGVAGQFIAASQSTQRHPLP